MYKSIPGPVWRVLGWVLVPLYFPHYRRLLIRSYMLSARLELLCTFFAVVSPFATPGMLQLIRGWLDQLRDDVAEFGRLVRAPRSPLLPHAGAETSFQNPWT